MGYDTEGAASRAEDDAEEEADPQKRPAAKVTVTIAGAGAKDDIVQELPDFVQELPSHLHPPQKLKEGLRTTPSAAAPSPRRSPFAWASVASTLSR